MIGIPKEYWMNIYIYISAGPCLQGATRLRRIVCHLLFTVLLFCIAVCCQLVTGIGILLTMCLALGLERSILPSPGGVSSFPVGSHYGPFSDLFFMPFSNTLLETMLEPLDAILVSFGCHFVSILGAPGHKNEVRNASPSSTGQTP